MLFAFPRGEGTKNSCLQKRERSKPTDAGQYLSSFGVCPANPLVPTAGTGAEPLAPHGVRGREKGSGRSSECLENFPLGKGPW